LDDLQKTIRPKDNDFHAIITEPTSNVTVLKSVFLDIAFIVLWGDQYLIYYFCIRLIIFKVMKLNPMP